MRPLLTRRVGLAMVLAARALVACQPAEAPGDAPPPRDGSAPPEDAASSLRDGSPTSPPDGTVRPSADGGMVADNDAAFDARRPDDGSAGDGAGDGAADSAAEGGSSCGLLPADVQATVRAAKTLCYLKTHAYVSGQTDWEDGDKVYGFTNGKFPAMIAFDFMGYTTPNATVGDTSQTQRAIDFFTGKGESSQHKGSKGIVQFQWHWVAPVPNGSYNTDWDWSGITDPNSQAYAKIVADIDIIGAEMVKMQNAGIVVVFRPLHESNNNYMWWAKRGPALYKSLWNVLFTRITGHWGVHNLLWVFNGMAEQNGDMGAFYPGDNQVDIVGSDYFQSGADLTTLSKIGANKVRSIPETFNALDPTKDAPWSYWDVWASRDWKGGVQATIQTAMANPKTISITDLPDMTAW